jgi:hypothetical protein
MADNPLSMQSLEELKIRQTPKPTPSKKLLYKDKFSYTPENSSGIGAAAAHGDIKKIVLL